MAEQKKDKVKQENAQTPSRTNMLRNRPKKYNTRYKEEDEKRKYPPKTL